MERERASAKGNPGDVLCLSRKSSEALLAEDTLSKETKNSVPRRRYVT